MTGLMSSSSDSSFVLERMWKTLRRVHLLSRRGEASPRKVRSPLPERAEEE